MNFENLLDSYKKLTNEMIEQVEKDEDISLLIEKRHEILTNILNLNDDKNNLKEQFNNSEIKMLEDKLQNIIKNKMTEIKKELLELKKSKAAFNQYCNFSSNPVIFSTKI